MNLRTRIQNKDSEQDKSKGRAQGAPRSLLQPLSIDPRENTGKAGELQRIQRRLHYYRVIKVNPAFMEKKWKQAQASNQRLKEQPTMGVEGNKWGHTPAQTCSILSIEIHLASVR
jgi:hypothetical protein